MTSTGERSAPEPLDRPAVVVDCDPGHDDVVALAVAAAWCRVVAITTVAGNAPVDRCTRNALAAADVLGIRAPVHEGASTPLARPPRHSAALHGESGLAGVEVPAARSAASEVGAVDAIAAAAREHPGLWVVATGPLTNVASALRADPGLAERLGGVSWMGGAVHGGNVTPTAEYNAWFDPEAASAVLGSGVPVRMAGLDVTLQVRAGPAEVHRLRQAGEPAGTFVADVLAASIAGYREISGRSEAPLHDPCALVALVRPDLMRFEDLHVAVECRGELTEGMTVADRRTTTRGTRQPPNVAVAVGVDGPGAVDLVVRGAAGAPCR